MRGSAIAQWLRTLSRGAVTRPRLALGLLGCLTLAGAAGLVRTELCTDGHALVPTRDPTVRFDAAVRESFGLRDQILVWVETTHPDGIYNTRTLRIVEELTVLLSGLDGIGEGNVMSLATEARPRIDPRTLRFERLLDPFPTTPERIEWLRKDVEAIALLTGTLVSQDARATTLLVGVPPSTCADPAGADRTAFYHAIRAAVAPFESASDRILVVGAPVAEALLGRHILEDLVVLVPLAVSVIAVVLWIGCRRVWGVALALGEVGACLLFTFGVMGWAGVPVYLTTAVLPVILVTIGLADEIHIFWHYQRALAAEDAPAHPGALVRALDEMVRPVTLTSVTTALGFLSFLMAPIAPVQSFGAFAALGIAFCWLWSLVAIPAQLALLGPEKLRRPAARRERAGAALARTERLARPLLSRPDRTLWAVLVATVALGVGALGLRVQDSWIDGFAPASPFRAATERVDAGLYGTHVLIAHLSFEGDRPLLDPNVLEAIGAFEAACRADPRVGGVLGAHSHLATVNYLFFGQRPGMRRIPDAAPGIALVVEQFDHVRGEQRRREVIHDDLRRTLVTLFLRNANYRDTAALMDAIRGYGAAHLAPHGGRVAFAGDIAVSQAMIPAIVRTQLGSLFLALGGALGVVWLLTGSVRMALQALLPTLLAVVWVFGLMGWLGIAIGVATSTFCAITFGIGVDYAIHFLERLGWAAPGAGTERVAQAWREAGPAIVTDALAVTLGFGVLIFSRVPANARLGLLVSASLLAATCLTLIGLGAWIARPASGRSAPSDRSHSAASGPSRASG